MESQIVVVQLSHPSLHILTLFLNLLKLGHEVVLFVRLLLQFFVFLGQVADLPLQLLDLVFLSFFALLKRFDLASDGQLVLLSVSLSSKDVSQPSMFVLTSIVWRL